MAGQTYPVTIELTGSQYQRMKSIASKRSTPEKTFRVADLVEQLVDHALSPMSSERHRIAQRDLTIRQLHQAGLNDRQISEELDCTPRTVFRTRHRLGLERNDPRGGDHRPNRGA